MHRLGIPLPLAIGLVLTGAAAAQTAPNTSSSDASGLQEVVVTATRHEESLSKVPLSVTAFTQESIDVRGIKDITDVAKFTPGIHVDNSGTANISIRGIASSGGAGTTGIYIDDTPIQMRAIAFNPDESLPKSFDIERVEVLRGPQGTLFGAGSEGGTVRYITTPASLTTSSLYSRSELAFTQGGAPSYEAGVAAGGPLIDDTFGARLSVWYREDGGWINRIDPTNNPPNSVIDRNTNHTETTLVRLSGVWKISDRWTVMPSIYYQSRSEHDISNYWPLYSNPSSDNYVSGNPTARNTPDTFYLPALKIEADFGSVQLISNSSYYHRHETTGYDGTLYNLGFYQSLFVYYDPANPNLNFPLYMDGNGIHLPAGAVNYRAPATVDNGQQNLVQEIRLQSTDPNAALIWTAGLFWSSNRQSYLEQVHDPLLNQLLAVSYPLAGLQPVAGGDYVSDFFGGIGFDPKYPNDSYFLNTRATDDQIALFGEGSYAFTDQWKLTAGARIAKVKYSFESLTGGPQLYLPNISLSGDHQETAFTPKLGVSYQHDPNNLYYATYAKGFRPGGANNPVPQAACALDFANFGINASPATYNSDTVQSYEVGSKNNFDNRLKIASSVYYIKWNNIQQTVLPPICQISWIQNLGQAVAKGADIQAEAALTDALTAEFSAGYTDARYTTSSYVGAIGAGAPVAAAGDAITGQGGQPNAPVTASLGLEYKFIVNGHKAFIRADDEYRGKPKWSSPGQDPNSAQYDSANYLLSSTSFVTLRTGMSFGAWQVSLFADNLLDSHTITNYNWTIDPGTGATRLQRDWTFRPRTIGMTFVYRD